MTVHAAPSVEIIRCYREGETYSDMHPYAGCAQLTYTHPRAAMVTGMHGKWARQDMVDMMQHVHSHGITWLLADRAPGHGLAWGELVEDAGCPEDGLWRINLVELFGAFDSDRSGAGGDYAAGAVSGCHAAPVVLVDCVKECRESA